MDSDPNEVAQDRLGFSRRAAAELGSTVLLKGTTTVVAAPDGRARINPTGTAWLGTAGSGDVLSGACGALLASGLEPLDAGAVAAFVHGLAGRFAAARDVPIAAGDLIDTWADAERAVRSAP